MKPAFVLPKMADVERARGTTGLKVVSTFSGCGGSCLGFEQAGYRVVWANEFVDSARETYAANHPEVPLDGRDIREVRPEEILKAVGLTPGELDVFQGSPPCASFSTSGKREAGWGKVKAYSDREQRTDDLFFEYVRILRGLKPKVFVAENVAGLTIGKAVGYFKIIMRELAESGYRVRCKILDAQWLGVPQIRRRTIFVGVREDLGFEPVYPKPLPYSYPLKEVLQGVARVVHDTSGLFSTGDVTDSPCPTITVSGGAAPVHFKVTDETSFKGYAIEKEWRSLRKGKWSRKYQNLMRPSRERPVDTITASGGSSLSIASITHPDEPRKFTIAELKKICAFPEDFELKGTYAQQWERLGRAVPPRMMFYVARTLRDEVFAPLGLVRPSFIEAF